MIGSMQGTAPGRRRRRLALGAAGMTAAMLVQPAAAQVTPQQLPSQSEISRIRVPDAPLEAPRFDFRIQAPEKAAVPKAIDAVEFQVKRIVVEGATAFPAAEVDAYFAPLLGKPIGLQAVRDAAAALEARYRDKGYFLSRVFVPPQQVEDDTLKIRVIEGYIDEIFVEGMDEASRESVRRMLAPLLEKKPIDLASVEQRLLTLNDLPGLSGSSVLRQGSQVGGSTLVVSLAQPRNLYVATVNNTSSNILGPWAYGLNADLVRPFGLPGALTVGFGASGPRLRSTQTVSARYALPIGDHGLIYTVGMIVAKARPGGSLRPLEIVNNLVSLTASARYPLLRGRGDSLYLEGGLTVTRSETEILGQPLVDDRTSVGELGLVYQQNGWMNGTTTLSLSAFQGIDLFGAIDRGAPRPSVAGFDPHFLKLNFGVQRVQSFPAGFSTLLSIQGQYSESKLLSGETVAFGGTAIGRGYDPSAITGDRGIGALAEIRYDLVVGKPWLASAQLYAFVDGARTLTLATPLVAEAEERIGSLGLGVRLYHRHGMVDLQAADARRRLGGADERRDPRLLLSASFLY